METGAAGTLISPGSRRQNHTSKCRGDESWSRPSHQSEPEPGGAGEIWVHLISRSWRLQITSLGGPPRGNQASAAAYMWLGLSSSPSSLRGWFLGLFSSAPLLPAAGLLLWLRGSEEWARRDASSRRNRISSGSSPASCAFDSGIVYCELARSSGWLERSQSEDGEALRGVGVGLVGGSLEKGGQRRRHLRPRERERWFLAASCSFPLLLLLGRRRCTRKD